MILWKFKKVAHLCGLFVPIGAELKMIYQGVNRKINPVFAAICRPAPRNGSQVTNSQTKMREKPTALAEKDVRDTATSAREVVITG